MLCEVGSRWLQKHSELRPLSQWHQSRRAKTCCHVNKIGIHCRHFPSANRPRLFLCLFSKSLPPQFYCVFWGFFKSHFMTIETLRVNKVMRSAKVQDPTSLLALQKTQNDNFKTETLPSKPSRCHGQALILSHKKSAMLSCKFAVTPYEIKDHKLGFFSPKRM